MNRKRPGRPLVPHPTDQTLMLVPLTRGHFAVISAVDAPIVGQFNWQAHSGKFGAIYATRKGVENPNGRQRLHRMIAAEMGIPDGVLVDHANRITLDCRRSNLRAADKSQNGINRRPSPRATSGYHGVSRFRDKWKAQFTWRKERLYLGLFLTKELAASAVRAAMLSHVGDFTPDYIREMQ